MVKVTALAVQPTEQLLLNLDRPKTVIFLLMAPSESARRTLAAFVIGSRRT